MMEDHDTENTVAIGIAQDSGGFYWIARTEGPADPFCRGMKVFPERHQALADFQSTAERFGWKNWVLDVPIKGVEE